MEKLESYSTWGILNKWFNSFLSCAHFVKITQIDCNNSMLNRYLSSHRELSYDVPQGCILGLLFLLYISDIHRYVKGVKMVLHAGNTIILAEVRDADMRELKTASAVKQLEAWFLKIYLTLDMAKTGVMFLHSSQCRHPYKPYICYNNNDISYGSKFKFLGMNVTENLNLHIHICASLSKIYFIILTLKDVMRFRMIQTVYYACFQL